MVVAVSNMVSCYCRGKLSLLFAERPNGHKLYKVMDGNFLKSTDKIVMEIRRQARKKTQTNSNDREISETTKCRILSLITSAGQRGRPNST